MNLLALNPPLPPWSDCKVWLIGGSSGIGAAVAQHLLKAGAKVAISARNAQALATTADGHPNAKLLALDMTDTKAVTAAWKKLRKAWGRIDLVLFVAAIYEPTRAWELEPAKIDKILDTNLGSVMRACSVIVPDMVRDQCGAIAFVSSVAGYGGMVNCITYGPTKAGLSNFAEAMYIDLHEKNIGVYLISPGFVRTPGTKVNDFHMPALMEPEQAATAMVKGMERGEFDIHFPKRFTHAMKALNALPYPLYFQAVMKVASRL